MREVIEKIRGEAPAAGTDDGAILTASLGVSDRQIQTYDPRAHIVESLDDLKALEARARSEGKALYAYYCGKRETAARLPEVVARLDESRLYDEIGKLGIPGILELPRVPVSQAARSGGRRRRELAASRWIRRGQQVVETVVGGDGSPSRPVEGAPP
ncbi:MAG: hypothetical protein R3F11_04810 [Verrucomicrobiales bacterium]